MKSRTSLYTIFNSVFIVIYLTWIFVPKVNNYLSDIYIFTMMTFFCLYNLLPVFYDKKVSINKKELLFIGIILSWFILLFTYYLYNLKDVAIGNLLNIYMFFIPVFILQLLNNNKKLLNLIINITFILVIFTSITNIIILLNDPYASKYYIGSVESAIKEYENTNLASLDFLSFTVFYSSFIYLFYILLNTSKYKLLYLVAFIIMGIYIFMSGSSISTLIFVLLIILLTTLFIFKKLKFSTPTISSSFFALIALIILFKSIIVDVIIDISNYIDNPLYYSRIISLTNFIEGHQTVGSLSERLTSIKISFNTFLENPLFGKGMVYQANTYESGIGMHSQLIDDLGRYGLLGFTYFLILIYLYFLNNKIISRKNSGFLIVILCGMFTLAFINPFINQNIGVLIFMIIPIIINNHFEEEKFNASSICSK